MPILTMCCNPACGEIFDAPDEAAGQSIACPACGTVQPVGQALPRPLPAKEAPAPQPPQPAGWEAPEPAAEVELETAKPPRPEADRAAGPTAADEIDLVPAEPAEAAAPAAGPPAWRKPAAPTEKAQHPPAKAFPGDELEGMPFLPHVGAFDLVAEAEAVSDEELAHKPAPAVIFSMGLLGIGAGLAVGLVFFPRWPILSAYGGAALGWVVGFVAAFLILLAVEREDAGQPRCRLCRHVLPTGAETCGWCGSPVSAQGMDPLNAGCLKAGSYAVSNLTNVLGVVLPLVAWTLLLVLALHLPTPPGSALRLWRPVLIGLSALLGLLVFAHWVELLLVAVSQTLSDSTKAPDTPRFWSLGNLGGALKGLGVLAMYVLPVCTIPLLPVGLLSLGRPGRTGAFDLPKAARTAWRHCRDFTIMWLWLLLWSSMMFLAFAAAVVLLQRVSGLIPSVPGYSGVLLSMILSAAVVAILGPIGCIFGLALFRCIGMFGRHVALAAAPQDRGGEPAAEAGTVAEDRHEPV